MKKLLLLFFGFFFFSGTCFPKETVTDNVGLDRSEKLLPVVSQTSDSPLVYDTIRSLVISEVRMDDWKWSYLEITNMSETDAVDLSKIEVGSLTTWTYNYDNVPQNQRIMLPKITLQPGESYVIATVYDLPTKMKNIDPERWVGLQRTQLDWWDGLADLYIHPAETDNGSYPKLDSVTPLGASCLDPGRGTYVFYLRQHFNETDSVVIDEVNAVFDRRAGIYPDLYQIAGNYNATRNSVLIRKSSVKTGDLFGDSWLATRGSNPENSEWILVPLPKNSLGKEGIKVKNFWTVGNHGNFRLTPENFKSSTVEINWLDTVLTVPWGIRNEYKIMGCFDYSPGLAWKYNRSLNREDSVYTSVRTGDTLTIYACGDKLEKWNFRIVVQPPTIGANIVIPKNSLNNDGKYGTNPYNVTINALSMDTIYDVGFATRIDTLLKYLEKAPTATWEIIPVDGIVRPDLKNGDRLKVTAQNGAVKNYFIKVDAYLSSHNASLSAITWPDIPDSLRGQNGWKGDTIPGFKSSVFNYLLELPAEVVNIPALVAKTSDMNAKVEIKRVKFLNGTLAERIIQIKTAAEDDTTFLVYKIILSIEITPAKKQPFKAEPFFSQRTHAENWYGSAMEICNPGNLPVDLSNYMLVRSGNDGSPAAAIEKAKTAAFNTRYNFYIPGRVWGNETSWQVAPYKAIPDLVVNPVVQGNDVFVVAALGGNYYGLCDNPDVEFWPNPWGDALISARDGGIGGNPVNGHSSNDTYYLFKILNDSVKNGTKSIGDPTDFKLIDVFGNGDSTRWVIGGFQIDQIMRMERRPQYWKGNPAYKGSFGTTSVVLPKRYPPENDGEWDVKDRTWFGSQGYSYPNDIRGPLIGLGSFTLNPITFYRSTVSSTTYKVSPGYSLNETIRGVITGTTVDQFLSNITKDDPGQTLILKDGPDILYLGDNPLRNGDTLIVKSQVFVERDGDPNKQNITKYILNVTAQGLSSNARLTSPVYSISINENTGTISGFPYGTKLKSVADSVVVPAGATFAVINEIENWVPFKMLNFDTTYIDVIVNDKTYFEVVAEDKKTTIRYQLKPTIGFHDIFVTSDLYVVDQSSSIIKFIPRNTSVHTLLANLVPSPGAKVVVLDKSGNERKTGTIYQDDKVFASYPDHGLRKVYYLSMLLTKEALGETVNYLAYIESDVYRIDQYYLEIENINICFPSHTELLANLIPSEGASVTVVDDKGKEVTDRRLRWGDKAKVIAADGTSVVYYMIDLFLCYNVNITENDIQVYPSPTTGIVSIKGIGTGCRIRVFNAMGINIGNEVVQSNLAEISLASQPPGIYLILVENDNQLVGRFKVIRE